MRSDLPCQHSPPSCVAILLDSSPHQAASSSARRASYCSTPRPSSSGCSAASSCCFTGPLPLSSAACPGTPWPCWPGEERWGLAGENAKWTLCRCPAHSLTPTHLRTCPYCSLSAAVASHARFCLENSGGRDGFHGSFPVRWLLPSGFHSLLAPRMNVCRLSRGICFMGVCLCECTCACHSLALSKRTCLHFAQV